MTDFTSKNDLASRDYWEDRAKDKGAKLEAVFVDVRAQGHENYIKTFLSKFRDMSALDVACGYGRFADCFENYTGIDFSQNFIDMAQKANPEKNFKCVDAHTVELGKYDIVFSVISLSSLKQTPEEFYEKWKDTAKFAIFVFEVDRFYFYPKL